MLCNTEPETLYREKYYLYLLIAWSMEYYLAINMKFNKMKFVKQKSRSIASIFD